MSYYEIEFKHPDYEAMDCMHYCANKRFIKAENVTDAVTIFKITFPRFENILKVDNTTCNTLDELKTWYPWFDSKVNELK